MTRDERVQHFYENTIGESKDLTDQLQDLADFLKEFTKSTACYIGKLVAPKKPIKEDDDERAHIDPDAANVIQFINASEGHDYLVDKVLKQDQGLTFDVFKDPEAAPVEEGEKAEEEVTASLKSPQKEKPEVLPRTIYVKEVVREPRMHFYQVPRLGCYMAIRLEYESCLFEESLDAAVVDYIEVRQRQKEQEEEKKSFLEKAAQEERENEGDQTFDSANLSTNRRWEEIKPKPFKTRKIQFVVCLNTLGQDREFTQDEMLFAQRTIRDFAKAWEHIEHKNLEQDVLLRLASIEHDLDYKKTKEPVDNADLEKRVEESILPKEGDDPMEEDVKTQTQKRTRHKLMTRGFFFDDKAPKAKGFREHQQITIEGGVQYTPLAANQWKDAILTFGKYHVIKMPKVFQGLFYLLGYKREEICERDTNKIEWKKARKVLLGPNEDGAEFFKRIGEYNPFGPKEDLFTLYQKLRFLKKSLKKHEQEIEKVEEYSIPLSKLFKWMLYSIELRAQDVIHRREVKNKLKEERKVAEEAANERERNRREACEHARNVSYFKT